MFFSPLICDLILHYSYSDQIYTLFFLFQSVRLFFVLLSPLVHFVPLLVLFLLRKLPPLQLNSSVQI